MAEVEFNPPPSAIALVAGHKFTESKNIELRCHDRLFENATLTDETGAEIFHVKSKYGQSWSFRRSLFDTANNHILDFRHYSLDMKNRWTIEDPIGKELAKIEHSKQVSKLHSNVDFTVLKARDGGEDAVIHMRQKDSSGVTTYVAFEGATVAEISMVERNFEFGDQLIQDKDRTSWRTRVAATMDLSIIVIMALCRAEMAHVWRQ